MRTSARIALACCFALCSVQLSSAKNGVDIDAVKATLEKRFPTVNIDSIAAAPWGGLYEVVTDGEIAYTNEDGSLLFAGKILDTDSKVDLTTQRWNEIHRIDFAALPFDRAIKIVKGDGSRTLAIFEDPLCPFCEQLEKELQSVDDVTLYIFLFPLEDIHPGAAKLARSIWCAEDREETWKQWMSTRTKPTDKSCPDPIAELIRLGAQLKINSTPTLVFANGIRNSGLLKAADLQAALAR